MIELTDSNLQSWVNVPENSDFPIQNIPLRFFVIWNLLDANRAFHFRNSQRFCDFALISNSK